MELFDKNKMTDKFGKVVDAANDTAEKVEQFAKDKELDEKLDDAKEKMEKFVKDKGLDEKADDIKEKTKDIFNKF